jgi:two-component system chemotaxis response regulator CheB
MMNAKKLRIVVADDSVVVRQLLVDVISAQPDMEVVASVSDGLRAVNAVSQLLPDLITMDVAMPGLDGVEATRAIMHARPTPILIITSSEVGPTSVTTFRALAAGALDVLHKPDGKLLRDSIAYRRTFIARIRELATLRKRTESWRSALATAPTRPPPSVLRQSSGRGSERAELIAVGASTGGPQVLRTVLGMLDPKNVPPVLVVQHMSPEFVESFAAWLGELLPVPVVVARHGQMAQRGQIHVAPAHHHMRINAMRTIELDDGPVYQHQRPSIDLMFESVAACFGQSALGVLLTGMGNDGAQGLLSMRHAGARTIAQDEESCVVYGMPKVAFELGAVSNGTSPAMIAERLSQIHYQGPVMPRSNSEPADDGAVGSRPFKPEGGSQMLGAAPRSKR